MTDQDQNEGLVGNALCAHQEEHSSHGGTAIDGFSGGELVLADHAFAFATRKLITVCDPTSDWTPQKCLNGGGISKRNALSVALDSSINGTDFSLSKGEPAWSRPWVRCASVNVPASGPEHDDGCKVQSFLANRFRSSWWGESSAWSSCTRCAP